MPEQKIILSVIGQVLAGTEDRQLLKFIKMVSGELIDLITEFDLGDTALPQIDNGQFSDMASNQIGTE